MSSTDDQTDLKAGHPPAGKCAAYVVLSIILVHAKCSHHFVFNSPDGECRVLTSFICILHLFSDCMLIEFDAHL